jgi:Mrp family chromosome partitioning ATPase
MLSRCFAARAFNVGVLDIDICGPSLPRIFGVEGEQVWTYTNLSPTPLDEIVEIDHRKILGVS